MADTQGLDLPVDDVLRALMRPSASGDMVLPPTQGLTNRYIDPNHPLTQALAGSMQHAADVPRQAWQESENLRNTGQYDPGPVVSASNLAMTGAFPFASKNALGIFGGRLAATADHAALKKAEELAASGAPREHIWDQTGWFQGPDQKWRFEIPDNKASAMPGFGTAEEMITHPEFFKAYPHTKEYEAMGDFGDHMGTFFGDAFASRAPTAKGITANMLHEMQHAAQQAEGFPRGTSPTMERESFIGENPGMPSTSDKTLNAIAVNRYYRNSGEVEARNVQTRMNMTPEQRKAQPPWLTQDVPDAQQIIRALQGK